MCGIYGSTTIHTLEILKEKMARINFRGPDYSGIHHTEDIILGHNRLAIIDLDYRSNQPFIFEHLSIVFNGEIYNYQDIRNTLANKGYKFQTTSDTEVICAAYLAFGPECLHHFNGMFAFVIYNSKTKTLFGARDRFGKKPLYYYHNGVDFEFASQPSQIKIARNLTVDTQAINEYYIWGYIPEPRSIWKEVKKLPAAHSFTYNLQTGEFLMQKYWDLEQSPSSRFSGTYNQAKEELSELLLDAVKIRMFADVPLGVFLSGGVDSSLITALATKNTSNLQTFSIKFHEQGFDESPYAKQVADHLGTQHNTIDCNYNEGINLIKNFGQYYDEPFADSSAIPSLLLSKYTRQRVTVALSGDAGDEGFIGYSRYKWFKMVSPIFTLPLVVRHLIGSTARMSPNYVHKLVGMGISVKDLNTLYKKMFGGMENSWVKFQEAGLNSPFTTLLMNKSKPLVENLADFDIKTYLNGDINTKVDRASMAFSLESRSPLMDYRVIEFARSLPLEYKYNGKVQKRILKDLLYQHVPAKIFDRPKAGFTMPFKEWFRNELKEYVLDNLSNKELQNIPGINIQRTEEIIKEHMTGKWNRYPQIWKLLVLSQWLKQQKEGSLDANFIQSAANNNQFV
ncbi:asparagine synthase (glutamine-hydrolyzing) [Desertivirga arenae]|uniref:asparagine synthase (glutamine-hydrolyzing) n=1 Tax=Desertivirga arenae TaxID=2810309 RepID=UPI001A979075|nr:asparagine synthase (glutamine-hydrolyzing) [Pedobacter sp. SYSU D00823]